MFMKKLFAAIVVLFYFTQPSFAQNQEQAYATDTINGKKIDLLTNQAEAIKTSVNAIKSDVDKIKSDSTNCDCVPYQPLEEVEQPGEWFIIISPFYLLILVVLIVAIRLSKFKFTEALTENDPPKKTIKNPEYNAAIIAANSNTPNLSILFPPTIEVSNISPTVIELQEIAAAKEVSLLSVQTALRLANIQKPELDKAATIAAAELNALKDAKQQLDADVKTAQDALLAANANEPKDQTAIDEADKKLAAAKKLVADNDEAVKVATEKFDAAEKAVTENSDTISKSADLLPMLQLQSDNAKKIAETAAKIPSDSAAYSTGTYRPSISRYIAFITSMVIIILVVCMSSFFIYHYMRTGCPPEFGALTVMLIALGLGVTPYITNKISTAVAKDK